MANQVTLTVSDSVMAHARSVARATGRPVETVLSEQLEASTRPLWTHPDQAAMAREIASYEAMHSQLVRNHLGKYVAITEGEVADHDPERAALLARLEASHPGQVVLVRRVAQTLPQDAWIPAVRHAREDGG